uniref:Cystatin F n=1 Tax=Varanus komodoensis TaxID=61221 RepID=A0A8D2JAW9_VARKO
VLAFLKYCPFVNCCLCSGIKGQLPNSNIQPGVPVHVKTNDPGVQKAARFGVYRYNNSSNDIFLFKESCINNATIQVVKGLKYRLDVDIRRTVCRKRVQPDLDQCDFQRNKKLRQKFRCYFEVWLIPWLQRIQVPVSLCH